ncbi:MAG: ABC transporter substrate-binding protein [Magnetococcales bacterium]|nr:ABC transporter substrate-binding protein [Magnetococcales bacterium]
MQKFRQWIATLNKKQLFMLILAAALAVASLISLFVGLFILKEPAGNAMRIAVVAPMTGPDKSQGDAMQQGVALLVQQINRQGGIHGRQLAVKYVDEGNSPAEALQAAQQAEADPDVVAVLGHWNSSATAKAIPYYGDRALPAILMTNGPEKAYQENTWVFQPLIDESTETRFLANYLRNVVGEKTVFILHEATPRGEQLATSFDEVYQRFGTKILYKWAMPTDGKAMDQELKNVIAEVESKKLFGSFLVLGEVDSTTRMIAALREAGIRQRIVGLRHLASKGFLETFITNWKGKGTSASALNGTLMTTPMLFDTSGDRAQKFNTSFTNQYGNAPDWVAAYAYESAKLIAASLFDAVSSKDRDTPLRQRLRDRIAARNSVENAFVGLNGPLFFNAKGVATRDSMVGNYDGTNLVSALTQLSPIREEGVTNLLAEVTAGRALYVNNRFMYKTNVVYTGVRLEKISALDRSANTADIDFAVWFRWRGDFAPQDVVFTNAVTPIALEQPVREGKDGDMSYRAYRIKGKFYLGYSEAERNYGTLLVGLAFHHRTLGSHNLMYVGDILGLNLLNQHLGQDAKDPLESKLSISHAESEKKSDGWLNKALSWFHSNDDMTDPMVASLMRDQVLAGASGWLIMRGWVSQEIKPRGVDGNPLFVGFGKPRPLFSMLDAGMVLKPDRFDARDVLSSTDQFVYLAIFSLVMSVLARLLDIKERGQFWRIQTLFLRMIFWPLLLMTLGNLARDYSLQNFTNSTVDSVVMVFDICWFIVPARLAIISLERFIWVPLETRTQRKIPNVLRMTIVLLIYVMAGFGVVAFVFDKSITSMLATSGMMAMIIGMAVQSNLRDIVSGIMLNIERPFNIGDTIKLNNSIGVVSDITWRTTRINSLDGQMISFPNSKTSDTEIQNFTKPRCIKRNLEVYTDPKHDPALVLKIIKECLAQVKSLPNELPSDAPKVYYYGVQLKNDRWVSFYPVGLYMPFSKRKAAIQEFWQLIWKKFHENDIIWRDALEDEDPGQITPPVPVPAAATATHKP